jgi:septal ring factor EnvC (AmiA/AmiB activator)
MKRRTIIPILLCAFSLSLSAQSTKLIKQLEGKRGELQKQIAESESLLSTTKKDVGSQLSKLNALTGQIAERMKYIDAINEDMAALDKEIAAQSKELEELKAELKDKKSKYEASVKYLYKNKSIEERLMFILSADNLSQTYRRLRYVQEYATYQRLQGEDILKKQEQVNKKLAELNTVKAAKQDLLKEREAEKARLEAQQQEKRTLVANLQKKQKGLQAEINKKRREASQLNARIDRLIAEEIEKARKRAEEEARREAERKKREAAAVAAKSKNSSSSKSSSKSSSSSKGSSSAKGSSSSSSSSSKAKPVEAYRMSSEDRTLSGNFANNKGRLPIPVTGPYIITSHYGQYDVAGLRNVTLDNKGIDIQAKPGAQARAIFSGKVAAVFQLNGLFNVLIRHGSYISVYCNLSSAAVKSGDTVSTKQTIGTIFSNKADDNRTVLHFQLRHEKDKLNPEQWLSR